MYFILFITPLVFILWEKRQFETEWKHITIFGLLTWQQMDKLTAFLVFFESCEMYFIECYRKRNKSKVYKYIIYVYLKRLSLALFTRLYIFTI